MNVLCEENSEIYVASGTGFVKPLSILNARTSYLNTSAEETKDIAATFSKIDRFPCY